MLPSVATSPSEIAAPLRILVVDDDSESRQTIEELLSRAGHACASANDGAEAWAKQQAQPFDVILADWTMPRMTGIELCGLVRSSAVAAYTYFVFMTARDDRAHFLDGMRAGADDYLTKPIDVEELQARLVVATRMIAMQRVLLARNAALLGETHAAFEEARVDALTQSANRLRLREDLAALESRTARYGHRYSAALADIDLFKSYNDASGHVAGDEALRRVAAAMTGALRKGDTLYRYGGEEFLVILPEQRIDEARCVLDRVRINVQALQIPHAHSATGVLTISVGIAELGSSGGTCDDWLRRADHALYDAKRRGRNQVQVDEALSEGGG